MSILSADLEIAGPPVRAMPVRILLVPLGILGSFGPVFANSGRFRAQLTIPKIERPRIPDIHQSSSGCLIGLISGEKEAVPRYLVCARICGVVNSQEEGGNFGDPSSGWLSQRSNDSFVILSHAYVDGRTATRSDKRNRRIYLPDSKGDKKGESLSF